jgi:hypothetical protein
MPRIIATRLGGDVAWQDDHKGEWAAILDFRAPPPPEITSPKPKGSL